MAEVSKLVTVPARPEPLTIDLSRTGVLVIDMQNDFGSKGGMFDRAGVDISQIQAAVAPTARVVNEARKHGMKVIFIQMQHRSDMSDAGSHESPHWMKLQRSMKIGNTVTSPDGRPGRILVENTWNTEMVKELTPQEGDAVVSKHRYSAFFQTNLETTLKTFGCTNLIVTGCTTSVCVESTVRDAMFRDFRCLVVEDCTAEPIGFDTSRSNHEASLLIMERLFGWITDSKQVIGALNGAAQAGNSAA
ncbi:MAG: isochorismatase family protein [Candidatus Binataceae bacterium]|nr:isochorismatase family protein [Candidatus Binataceae bacterium]